MREIKLHQRTPAERDVYWFDKIQRGEVTLEQYHVSMEADRQAVWAEILDATTLSRGTHFSLKEIELLEYAIKRTREDGVAPPLEDVARYLGIAQSTASERLARIRRKARSRLREGEK